MYDTFLIQNGKQQIRVLPAASPKNNLFSAEERAFQPARFQDRSACASKVKILQVPESQQGQENL